MRITLDNLSEDPTHAPGQIRLVYTKPNAHHNRLGINGHVFFWRHEIVSRWDGTWKLVQARKDHHDTLP